MSLVAWFVSSAFAAEVEVLDPDAKPPFDHDVSITWSPVHLVIPMVELAGEYRAADPVGVALILGAGGADGVTVVEFGGQGRWYPVGSFDHGMQLGAEVLAVHAFGSDSGVRARATGVTLGPFVGYKVAARFGLTFDTQLGVQFEAIDATATNGTSTASAGESKLGPLFNLNLGWSF